MLDGGDGAGGGLVVVVIDKNTDDSIANEDILCSVTEEHQL